MRELSVGLFYVPHVTGCVEKRFFGKQKKQCRDSLESFTSFCPQNAMFLTLSLQVLDNLDHFYVLRGKKKNQPDRNVVVVAVHNSPTKFR